RARAGDLDGGRAMLEKALASFETDPRNAGLVLTFLARVADLAGDRAEGIALADRAIERLSDLPGAAFAHAVRAELLLAEGRAMEARDASAIAIEKLEAAGIVEMYDALVRIVRAEALFASGDEAPGVTALAAARDALFDRAGRIKDPAMR